MPVLTHSSRRCFPACWKPAPNSSTALFPTLPSVNRPSWPCFRRGGSRALQEMQVTLSAILAEVHSADPMDQPCPAYFFVCDLRRHTVRAWQHHRHLVAAAGISGSGKPQQAAGRRARKLVVAFRRWLPRRCAQLRQMARHRPLSHPATPNHTAPWLTRHPSMPASEPGGFFAFVRTYMKLPSSTTSVYNWHNNSK